MTNCKSLNIDKTLDTQWKIGLIDLGKGTIHFSFY